MVGTDRGKASIAAEILFPVEVLAVFLDDRLEVLFLQIRSGAALLVVRVL